MLPLDSGIPPSAPRTGQVTFTTSGGPTPAACAFSHTLHLPLAVAYCYPSGVRDARNV